jgi:hypothetical protein
MFSTTPRIGRRTACANALPDVQEGDLLWGRHDYRAVRLGNLLGDAQRLVACPRREVDHHEVEVPPVHVDHHLLDRLDLQRAPPDHWGVPPDEELGHRYDLDSVGADGRLNPLIPGNDVGVLHPHELRDVWARHVCVQESDLRVRRESNGEVHRNTCLPDTALPAHHDKLVLNPAHFLGHPHPLPHRGHDVGRDLRGGLSFLGQRRLSPFIAT